MFSHQNVDSNLLLGKYIRKQIPEQNIRGIGNLVDLIWDCINLFQLWLSSFISMIWSNGTKVFVKLGWYFNMSIHLQQK